MTSSPAGVPPSSPPHLQTGQAAERAAALHLQSLGYRILERNYRGPRGEIDLIAEEGEYLVFVEVRARETVGFGVAAETVDPRKQRKLVRTARHYLRGRGDPRVPVRFDVLTFDGPGLSDLKLYRDAIEVEDCWA